MRMTGCRTSMSTRKIALSSQSGKVSGLSRSRRSTNLSHLRTSSLKTLKASKLLMKTNQAKSLLSKLLKLPPSLSKTRVPYSKSRRSRVITRVTHQKATKKKQSVGRMIPLRRLKMVTKTYRAKKTKLSVGQSQQTNNAPAQASLTILQVQKKQNCR